MQYHKSEAHMLKITANTANRCAEASIPPELRREVTESQGRVLGYLYLIGDYARIDALVSGENNED